MKKIVIFGASNFGEYVLNKISQNYEVIAFCDNDSNKWNTTLRNIPIIAPQQLNASNDIMIASMYHTEIVLQLIKMDILKFSVYSDMNVEKEHIYSYDYTQKNLEEQNNKVCILQESNSGSNALALYRYLQKSPKLEAVLIQEKGPRDHDYYYNILTSKMIIKTHETSYVRDKINVQLWHGFPLKGLSYMNKVKRNDLEKRHQIWNKSIIFSYSEMYNVLMGACYGIIREKFHVVGMPRNDILITANGKQNLKKVKNIEEDKRVIFYLPTYRKSNYGVINGQPKDAYLFDIGNVDELDSYLDETNSVLMVKLHPLEEVSYRSILMKYNNIVLLEEADLLKNEIDLYEILNSADMLITDYSSVYFDYLLLDRPIIFIHNDLEAYRHNTGFLLEPVDYWTPGTKGNTIEEIITQIQNNWIEDIYREERKTIKKIVHKFEDSSACERIETVLVELLK